MKKITAILNVILLIWFSFDMTGLSFGNSVLVSAAYKDDWIFLAIFLVAFVLFICNDRIGKYVLLGWLIMWFITQFYFHWFFTIWGPWEDKINYFSNTVKLIDSPTRYIPDLYHIILHVLILLAMISTLVYFFNKKTAANRT